MKRLSAAITAFLMVFMLFHQTASAYSYGDPGEEALAEAYKEIDSYTKNNRWAEAKTVYEGFEKEFDLYFKEVKPSIEQGFKEKDRELVLESYQAALRLNVERRLQFADKEFDNYGRAKLLLAKANGTFKVLSSTLESDKDKKTAKKIERSLQNSLKALGNPGLFGIGESNSDKEAFDKEVAYITGELKPLFPVPGEDKNKQFQEEHGFFHFTDSNSGDKVWLLISVSLVLILVILIILGKVKKRRQ
ncbi:hypothetical protein ACFQPF_06435 [Fictibacillus iocasae]|uniref:Secreted protein n=1 Tax=Fictibacillus iocasae TaxID=2715437 RepID=A0ABW2NKU9_9BACL